MFSMALTARAENSASSIQIYASVNEDGLADVTMTVRIRITEKVENLYFPLPLTATDIKLNDGSVNSTRGATAIQVRLGKDVCDVVGDHVVTFKFKIPDVVKVVTEQEKKLVLELPLLSGFAYPVNGVSLTVMLPETVENRPVFKSTYHQDSIDSILSCSVSNNMVTGLISQTLKDHETLTMNLVVPQSMFDGVNTYVREGTPELIPMLVLMGLALVYWLIFLRSMPVLRTRRNTAPEGITAGELGVRLTMSGADLTGMVFSWAQLGYLMIQLDDRGRVWLHKRMDMGNERSGFEVRIFKTLFKTRDTVDATGMRYAQLCAQVARANPGQKILSHPKCGNPKIFRWLFCAAMFFCGVCYAMTITGIAALQVILSIFFGAAAVLVAWLIQEGMYCLHLRRKMPLVTAVVVSVLWIGLGIWAGQWLMALGCVAAQMLAGLMAAYGRRRSELGRLNACQILGFRDYLKNADRSELKRIQENDPEYFYNQLPFAMALGVDKAFAERFGKKKLPACPYFSCGVKKKLTAEEWVPFFRETAKMMDYLYRRMERDRYAVIWTR